MFFVRKPRKWKSKSQRKLSRHPLIWAAELPEGDGAAIVTMFDEQTPNDEPNAFIYRASSGFIAATVNENERLVRMLGCYAEQGAIVFNAANEFEYVFNPATLAILSRRYYR